MNAKLISIIAVSAAVIVAGVAGIVVMNDRAAVARAAAAEAESRESVAKDEARKARAEEAAAEVQLEAQTKAAKAAEENRKAKVAEAEAAKLALEKSKVDRDRAQAEREKANAEAQAASDRKAAARADAEKARLEAERERSRTETEAAKAQAAEAALAKEKLLAEKVLAEAKALELRQIDFVTMERDLLEFKRELDEREAALKPEKTIKDLVWVSTEDTQFDEHGVARKKEKEPYLAERDTSLPVETRRLSQTERLMKERETDMLEYNRSVIVGTLERLYTHALEEDRVPDADFYRTTIKSMYPDWEYRPKNQEEVKK